MYAKRCSGFLDAVETLLRKAASRSSFSSIVVKRLRGKPLNIDAVRRSNRRGDKYGEETRSSKYHLHEKEQQLPGQDPVEERNKRKRITKLCKLLSDNLKNGKYETYEKNLSYGLSVAENPIELSQLINSISKGGYYSKGVKEIYTKLVDKASAIFQNVPVMSISLILNSMLKLDVYNENFLFLFFKNVDQILDESNAVDLTILFHFYVNGMGRFSGSANPHWVMPPLGDASPGEQSQVLLNSFLRRLHSVVPSLQVHGISSVLRCVKKLVMGVAREGELGGRTLDGVKRLDHVETIHQGKNHPCESPTQGEANRNGHQNRESILELITQINSRLRNTFYEKMAQANTQQLCNILEDLQFFNLIDNDCYYDVLCRLKGSIQRGKELKDMDYVNVLNTIKSRNIKHHDLLPFCYFSFLFDSLKVEDFSHFHYDRVAELAKIIFYFKKVYHVNFCMNKMELFLDKNDTNLIESTSTMIYLLDEFCTIGKSSAVRGSLRGKLFSCVVHRVFGGGSGVNGGAKNLQGGSTLTLEESLLLTKAAEGLVSRKKEDYPSIANQVRRRSFFLINCDEEVSIPFEHLDRYVQNVLYKISLLGKVRYRDAPLFLHLLKCCLLCSVHFSLKDILLLLRGLYHCLYFFTKENYVLLENVLNYLSALTVLQCRLVGRRKERARYRADVEKIMNRSGVEKIMNRSGEDKIMNRSGADRLLNCSDADQLLNRSGSLLSSENATGGMVDQMGCSELSEAYRKIERVLETNWAYLSGGGDEGVDASDKVATLEEEVNSSGRVVTLEEGGILSNSRRTKICPGDCCTLLYYLQRLGYVNKGVVRVVLSNLYDHVHALKSEQILKLVRGLSIIRNVDTEFSSFNSVFKRILLRFVGSHRGGAEVTRAEAKRAEVKTEEVNTAELKTDEPIKLLYLVSKLSIKVDHRNALIRKYLLVFLERQLGEGSMGVPQLELLMRSFKNMYPYRYVCLLECCLRAVSQALRGGVPTEQQRSRSRESSCNRLGGESVEGAARPPLSLPLPLPFLKSYFSVVPLLINPATNIHCGVNDLYMRTSRELLDQLYEQIKADAKLKEEFIPVLVTFVNLSFRDIPFVERYPNLMIGIFQMKQLIPPEQFFFFLLNVKFFGTQKGHAEVDSLLQNVGSLVEAHLGESLQWEGGKSSPLIGAPPPPHDFTFDRKKLVLLDTEDDNEMEIISREYNHIDPAEVHTRGERPTEKRSPHRSDCHEHEDPSKERSKRSKAAHHEFEIILKKYAYCQNSQKDKIEITKNVRMFSQNVKYVDLKKKIIFEFLEEENYFKEVDDASIEVLPFVYLRLFFWRKLNYSLVIMPFYEWHMCYGRLERVKAIFQKLLNVARDADSYLLETGKSRAFASVGRYE
ncbi:RAP protein, putative [Plasmodium vivax]|nr:RAP protein, putative [Plasmodium vivax]